MVHLPIMMGAISFFHSIPGIKSDGITLEPCILAKVFQRKIQFWDDDEIMASNPKLKLPYRNYPINVAHRVLGSSSTSSITKYLHQACPSEWPETMVGSKITWDEDTMSCDSSSLMVKCLRNNEGTIGYADAGHALQEGLDEVSLMNLSGRRVSSAEAAENDGIGAALVNLPSSPDMDFGDVNLINQDGDYTWPIVALTYVYVRKDLSFLSSEEQSLLVFFLKQLYNDDYIDQCKQYGFEIVPENVRQLGLAGIDMLQVADNATEWTVEGKETQPGDGQGDHVISSKRAGYAEVERNANAFAISSLQDQILELTDSAPQQNTISTASSSSSSSDVTFTQNEMTMISVALALGSISMILWVLTIVYILARKKGVVQ